MGNICEKCGFALEADAVFCPNCGTKVSTTASSDTLGRVPALCGQCGAKLKQDAKFCNKCGAPIGAIVKQNKISNPLQPVQSSSAPLAMQSSMQSMRLPAGINLPPG